MTTITITGDDQHLWALREACELLMRVAIGQFSGVTDSHVGRVGLATGKKWWDIEHEVEAACKAILMPGSHPNSSYSIGSREVSKKAKLCYELWKLLGGGTAYPPLNYSGVPLPKVQITEE